MSPRELRPLWRNVRKAVMLVVVATVGPLLVAGLIGRNVFLLVCAGCLFLMIAGMVGAELSKRIVIGPTQIEIRSALRKTKRLDLAQAEGLMGMSGQSRSPFLMLRDKRTNTRFEFPNWPGLDLRELARELGVPVVERNGELVSLSSGDIERMCPGLQPASQRLAAWMASPVALVVTCAVFLLLGIALSKA